MLKPQQHRSDLVNPHEWCREPSRSAVYFILYPEFIKIGWSSDLPKRLRTHLREAERHGVAAKVVAAVHGTKQDEHTIHRYFEKFNLANEDFSLARPLTDYIRWLRSQFFVGCGDDTYPNAAVTPDGVVLSVEKVEFDGWRPAPERSLGRPEQKPDLFNPLGTYEEFPPRVITGDDYYTPADIIERVRSAMLGRITLDPASHAAANATVKADRFYIKADNGLLQPWHGRVWLNPPFSEFPAFAAKAFQELDRGAIEILMMLASMQTLTTRYMRPLLNRADFLLIPCRRMQFEGPLSSSSPTGHYLMAFSARDEHLNAILRSFPADLFARYPRPIPSDASQYGREAA